MKDLQLCNDIVAKGLAMGAQEVEAFYFHEKKVEVMLEKQDLHIPKGDNYAGVGIRVIKDGRIGFTSTNQLDWPSLTDALQNALTLASVSTASEYNQLPDPRPVTFVPGLVDPNGFALTMEKAVEYAGNVLEILQADSRVVCDSGMISGRELSQAIANSRGIALREDLTLYEGLLIAFAREGANITSFDTEYTSETDFRHYDVCTLANKMVEKVLATLQATTIPSFKGSVILSPDAIDSIFAGPFASMLNGQRVLTGVSPLKDKLGQMVAASSLTMFDDPGLVGSGSSRSFDREGVPSAKLPLIENGRLNSFIYDHRTALKAKTISTGHAVGTDQRTMLNPTTLVIEPGQSSLKEMIRGVERGILVNRFSGNSSAVSGDFSGVVKGGYYIENGEISKPIREVMIAGNFYEMLMNIAQISSEQVFNGSLLAPYLQVEGISITGK